MLAKAVCDHITNEVPLLSVCFASPDVIRRLMRPLAFNVTALSRSDRCKGQFFAMSRPQVVVFLIRVRLPEIGAASLCRLDCLATLKGKR
jgi:hypothetical protein